MSTPTESTICGITDESGRFTCSKIWGHDDPTHAGVLRIEGGGGFGKSWPADDEEHLRRRAIKERSDGRS